MTDPANLRDCPTQCLPCEKSILCELSQHGIESFTLIEIELKIAGVSDGWVSCLYNSWLSPVQDNQRELSVNQSVL